MPDYNDCEKMRQLASQYANLTVLKQDAIEKWIDAEANLNNGIIIHNISEKWSWKKQVLQLCKMRPEYLVHHNLYYLGKKEEKTSAAGLKAIENEINILKKIVTETPK